MNIIKMIMLMGSSTVAFSSLPVSAQVVNFDTIDTFSTVDNFYAGGTASSGQTGPDYGIVFQNGDWLTTTAFGQTSSPNLAFSFSGMGSVNFLNGITTGLNFSYGGFSDTTLSVFEGLNGTGAMLGSFSLPTNDPYNFDFVALPFSGQAHSVVISGGASQFGWDDITFGTLTPGAVPELATWAMMLLGFAAIGGAMRRQTVTISYV